MKDVILMSMMSFCVATTFMACGKESTKFEETKQNQSEKSKKSGLDGMFGVKFGKIIRVNGPCKTNDVGALAYDYTPEKQFKDFSEYVLFATPITRQVFQIRAVCYVDSPDADDVMDAALKLLEIKYGKKFTSHDPKTKVASFENGDFIVVMKNYRRIMIDACCGRLFKLTKDEVKKVDEKLYVCDIEALALKPGKDADSDKVYRIDSVLGQDFGASFVGKGEEEQMEDGYWACEYTPKSRFMGCRDYRVFCTAKTKKAFIVRAVYVGSDSETKFGHFRRVIEMVTGRTMIQDDDDKNFQLLFGDVLIKLERDSIRDMITLDFVRIKLFQQNQKEQKEKAEKENSVDLDAL